MKKYPYKTKPSDWRRQPRKAPEKRKVSLFGPFRCTVAELEEIKARAAAAGMQLAEWVLKRLLG